MQRSAKHAVDATMWGRLERLVRRLADNTGDDEFAAGAAASNQIYVGTDVPAKLEAVAVRYVLHLPLK